LGLSVFLSVPSLAATVDPVRGRTSINQGDGVFHSVGDRLEAAIGDAVMVSPDGLARVVYPDGCVVEVKPGEVFTITGQSPCKVPSDNSPTQFSVGGVAAGAAVVGAGVGAILLLLNNKSNDKPASP
jgi:hypothetical protein